MTDVVHTNHDALKQISGQFEHDSALVKQAHDKLQSQMQTLKGGGWKAPAADQFYHIMEDEVLAGLERLTKALSMASQVSTTVSGIFQQAEDHAKSSLKF
jgi:WXG100 family type VII secretion target